MVILNNDCVALVVGDCTGKGLKAAQYTAEVKYALRVLLREYRHPTPAVRRLNTFILDAQRLDDRDQDAPVCITVAVVDTRTDETFIAAAGMEPPLVVRAGGQAESIEAGGLILGIESASEYPAEVITLGLSDILVLFTDGVTEARGPRPERKFFGYEGLTDVAWSAAELPVLETITAHVLHTIKAFAASGRPQDDICLLLARRTT